MAINYRNRALASLIYVPSLWLKRSVASGNPSTMYKITLVPSTNFIQSTLSEILTLDEVARYDSELKRFFSSGRARPGYAMLIDVSNCPIQPQEIVQAFGVHIANMPRAGAVCVVTGSSSIRMQVRRAFAEPPVKMFEDHGDALAWVTRVALRSD